MTNIFGRLVADLRHHKDGFVMPTIEQICVPDNGFKPRPNTDFHFMNIFNNGDAQSSKAMLGCVTNTEPATALFCAKVSWMSPYPGGSPDDK